MLWASWPGGQTTKTLVTGASNPGASGPATSPALPDAHRPLWVTPPFTQLLGLPLGWTLSPISLAHPAGSTFDTCPESTCHHRRPGPPLRHACPSPLPAPRPTWHPRGSTKCTDWITPLLRLEPPAAPAHAQSPGSPPGPARPHAGCTASPFARPHRFPGAASACHAWPFIRALLSGYPRHLPALPPIWVAVPTAPLRRGPC